MQNEPNRSLAQRLHDVQVTSRADLDYSRVILGGQPSYVVREPVTFQCHRFSAEDYRIFATLNHKNTLGETFDKLVRSGRLGQDREEHFYGFIVSLHHLGLLSLPLADAGALYGRFQRRHQAEQRSRILAPLFVQVPLLNPDAFLGRTVRHVAGLFTPAALLIWAALLALSIGMLAARWNDFWSPLSSILATENLIYLWLTLVGLKVIHEFGHAYACKHFGGAVPEMGALFILFTPCAYVDATAAWSLPRRWHRLAISLGGMYFESIAAIFATFLWCTTGPSLINSLAHQTILLAGIVTVGFNINPLMRYDGYYLLSDLADVPNLRRRATDAVLHFFKRWILGVPLAAPEGSRLRRSLLTVYGIARSIYLVSLLTAIFTLVAFKSYLLGIVLAVIFAARTLGSLGARVLNYLLRSPETAPVRGRAMVVTALLVALPLLVLAIPTSLPVHAYGVLGRTTETTVHSAAPGFVRQIDVLPGQTIQAGGPIYRLSNDDLTSRWYDLHAELVTTQVAMRSRLKENPAQAAAQQGEAEFLAKAVAKAQAQVQRLTITAPQTGQVLECLEQHEKNTFVPNGTKVARIGSGPWLVRLLVTAQELASIQPRIGQPIRVCVVSRDATWTTATVDRIAAAGSPKIDVPELTHMAGGQIAVDTQTMTARTSYFEISLRVNSDIVPQCRSGKTVLTQFQSRYEMLGSRLYRASHRFLNRLRQV